MHAFCFSVKQTVFFPCAAIAAAQPAAPAVPTLPQTGTTGWAAAALAAFGTGLLAAGQCLTRKAKRS